MAHRDQTAKTPKAQEQSFDSYCPRDISTTRISDRWRSLFLEGPVDLADIRLRRFQRVERKRGNYILPAGVGADFMIVGEAKDYKVPVRLERVDVRPGHGPGYCIWQVQHQSVDQSWRAARLSPFSFT